MINLSHSYTAKGGIKKQGTSKIVKCLAFKIVTNCYTCR